MTRTITPVEPTKRTVVPDEHIYATRCHWPCPCGGTVPDAPEDCKHKQYVARPNTHCTDAILCTSCSEMNDCYSYKNFKDLVRKQKALDILNANPNKDKEWFDEKPTLAPQQPVSTRRTVPSE